MPEIEADAGMLSLLQGLDVLAAPEKTLKGLRILARMTRKFVDRCSLSLEAAMRRTSITDRKTI
jgi:hypothetical protein